MGYLDDAFSAVNSWNTNHPSKTPKTIQLIVSPGFNSPEWLLDELHSCNPLFEAGHSVSADCGKVTFTNFHEGGDGTELPLPWSATYQAAWTTFLRALATRYSGNASFVSIAVAGPTAASAELILPNDHNTDTQKQFVAHGGVAMTANDMWKDLLKLQYADDAAYWGTDQAFIDAWNNAIDTYGEVFSNVTLVVATGNGLPGFLSTAGPFQPPVIPIDFSPDCLHPENMDCQAETTVLSHFVLPSVGGSNAKATQTSGLEATRSGPGDLGINGVRYLSQQTAGSTLTSQILGGAQFNNALSVKNHAETEGGSPIVEQALFYMLQDFFTGTSAASLYCGPSVPTPAPLNYLQIYYEDIQYASSHGKTSVAEGCLTLTVSAEDELNTASGQLAAIAEP